jgi:signal transduction histidine kinase
LWARDESGRPECLLSLGETATTRRFRTVAAQTLEGKEPVEGGLIVGVAVRRWQVPWAALVLRVRSRDHVDALLDEAASAISPIIERDFLLQRNAAHERTLVKASERRLARLGFDLHDGALQHIAALAADLRHLRPQLASTFTAQLDGVETRISELDRVLRELAHSLEPASLLRRPLERVIDAEVDALVERTGIAVRARVIGDFGAMTQSQKIALIRVLQEAFTNIREHSNASRVEVSVTGGRSCVEVQIEDDGDGFEVTRTLQDAAQRGRLGLVGSSERVRLLGGMFDIRSRPGGPTTVSLTLPRWQPVAADQDAVLQLAY